jgi:predicted ferric reductase
VYLLVSLLPLVIALTPSRPPGRGFWLDLSVALGFVGLSMLGLQFALTARFQGVAGPYGMDIVLRFHRQISMVAFGFILAHPVIVLVTQPGLRWIFNPLVAPGRTLLGMASLALLIAIMVTSVWRLRLRIGYEAWRVTHGILAVAVVGTALAHVAAVGYYVSLPWKRVLWVLLSVSLIGLLVWVRLVKPLLQYRRPWRVAEVRPERGDVTTLVLEPDGHDGVSFLGGQFAWLIIRNSPFHVVENPFSFSNSAEDRGGRVEFTIKELGDFTRTVPHIPVGTRAYLDGPYGMFTTERNEAPGFVFFAGGIGITPIASILKTLADRRDQRPMLLFYGTTEPGEAALLEELDRLRDRLDLRVVQVPQEPPEGWTGESGFIDAEMIGRHLGDDPSRRTFFICGPDPMMDAIEEALEQLGVAMDRVVTERFNLI